MIGTRQARSWGIDGPDDGTRKCRSCGYMTTTAKYPDYTCDGCKQGIPAPARVTVTGDGFVTGVQPVDDSQQH